MEPRSGTRNRAVLGLAAAIAVIAIIVGIVVLTRDDNDGDIVGTDTTSQPSTTTGPSTTDTAARPQVDAAVPVFPDPSTTRRFDDPVSAARAFATDLVGFVDPVVGAFAQGDSRSGEVEVRSVASGQPTTVLVRQLQDDTWFVIGASAESIRLDSPAQGATLSSPERLTGAASAFEGHVAVRLLADGVAEPIAETYVTGRGDGVLGDFSGELTFTAPAGARHGVLVLSEPSAKDGATIAATVIRVHF